MGGRPEYMGFVAPRPKGQREGGREDTAGMLWQVILAQARSRRQAGASCGGTCVQIPVNIAAGAGHHPWQQGAQVAAQATVAARQQAAIHRYAQGFGVSYHLMVAPTVYTKGHAM